MTAQQLYSAYESLVDTAGQLYLKPAKFYKLYWVCEIEWLKEQANLPITEATRSALRSFRVQATGGGLFIRLKDFKVPCMRVRAVRADFVGGRTDMPVTPVDSDELAERIQDPFRRGTDDDPLYSEEETAGVLSIFSDTAPISVKVSYLRFPIEPDPVKNEEPLGTVDHQWAIVRRVIAEKDLIDEKYNRYQMLAGRVIPTIDQPT